MNRETKIGRTQRHKTPEARREAWRAMVRYHQVTQRQESVIGTRRFKRNLARLTRAMRRNQKLIDGMVSSVAIAPPAEGLSLTIHA